MSTEIIKKLDDVTHKDLIDISAKWLKRHKENVKNPCCTTIFKDMVTQTYTGETPDVIGWNYWTSVLIEVKVSRSDFLRDKKKIFRRDGDMGMGEYRYYCCPAEMIKSKDLPEGWGLLWLNDKKKIDIIVEPVRKKAEKSCEVTMLLSKIRRLESEKKEIRSMLEEEKIERHQV
jgi:hypothetical protein